MKMSQELDALKVMGINPVRYLLSPVLLAMLVMVPAVTFYADIIGLLGGGLFSAAELGIGLDVYWERALDALDTEDLMQGLVKSILFSIQISLISAANGFSVSGGAEGVGRATTRAVVISIAAILVTDMIFTYFMNPFQT